MAAITASTSTCVQGVRRLPSCLAELGASGVDRGPQGTVADGVEFEMGVAHPGLLVDPTLDGRAGALLVEFVGIRRSGSERGEVSGEVAAAAFEPVDALAGGVGEQVVRVGVELGEQLFVEVAGGVGDRVDMPGRDRARGECVFERGQCGADLFAIGCGAGVLGGLAAMARQQVTGRFGVAVGGEVALPARDAYL